MDNIEAAGAGGGTARTPPPMYYAGPVALSATDNGTNATATATPFAFSMSQVRALLNSPGSRRDIHMLVTLHASSIRIACD